MSLDQPAGFVKYQTLTRDAFLGGRLILSQPGNGFRAGLESVLLGAAIKPESATLLDLGAGVGVASCVAMAYNPDLHATLVEQDAAMAALAVTNTGSNGFVCRSTLITADVTEKGAVRHMAGIFDNYYHSVIANPPFFSSGTRAHDSGRAAARHMDAAALDLWVRTAAGSVVADGEVIFIYPAESLAFLLISFQRRFGAVTILPLSSRPQGPVRRVLVRGIKGSRAPLTMLVNRALHPAEGSGFQPQFEVIFRGQGRLHW